MPDLVRVGGMRGALLGARYVRTIPARSCSAIDCLCYP